MELWKKIRRVLWRGGDHAESCSSEFNWGHYNLVQVCPGVLSLCKKSLKTGFDALDKDSASSVSSSTSSKYSAVFKSMQNGLSKSKAEYRVFSFGFNARHRSLPDLSSILESGHLEDRKCDYVASGVISTYECFSDAREAMAWKSGQANRIVVLLGASDIHLKMLVTAVLLLNVPHSRPEQAIADAHALFAKLWSGNPLVVRASSRSSLRFSFGRKKKTPSNNQSSPDLLQYISSAEQQASKPDLFAATSLWKSTNGPSTSQCISRVLGGLGHLSSIASSDSACLRSEEIFWRKMVLRKIVLSHAPMIGPSRSEDSHRGPCRPYVMIMNGDQTDFLFSTMVQGIKQHEYEKGVDVCFDINCRVSKDIVLKVYHLEPDKPGCLLLKTHVNVSTAEPVEDLVTYKESPGGEQLVIVSLGKSTMDQVVFPNAFESEFSIQLVFGMPSNMRAIHPVGPKCFPTEAETLGLSSHQPSSPTAERLARNSVANALEFEGVEYPPIQFKCPNSMCGRVQYLSRAGTDVIAETQCSTCNTELRLAPSIVTFQSSLSTTGLIGDGEDETITSSQHSSPTSTHRSDDISFSSPPSHSDVPSIPAPAPLPPVSPTSEVSTTTSVDEQPAAEGQEEQQQQGSSSEEQNSYDYETYLQNNLEHIVAVLEFTGLSRDRIERRLRTSLQFCSNDEEAASVVETFVSNAFEEGTPAPSPPETFPIPRELRNNEDLDFLWRLGVIEMVEGLNMVFRGRGGSRRRYGMSRSDVARLPVHSFTASSTQKSCSICLLEYEVGDSLRTLPCFHSYHVDCIDRWLMDNTKCPVCQRDAQNIAESPSSE